MLPWGQMSYWGATVITNLLSAIPWVGTDLVEFIYLLFILAILPTIGSVNYKALRGRAPRTENEKRYALNIPFDFLSMLLGLIDGDGYISITQIPGGFIRIQLILSMNMEELDMVKYIQSVLKVGRINTYPAINTVKYIISRTDLQEVVFPLLAHHGLFFLTNVRRAQFDRAMFILQNNINLFSQLPSEIPTRNSLPTTPPWSWTVPRPGLGYTQLPFFLNLGPGLSQGQGWIVGFTIAEGSFFCKANQDICFSLRQRSHPLLFAAFKVVFHTNTMGEEGGGYSKFIVSSVKDIQTVVDFFSFSDLHPLMGRKLTQYNKWINNLRPKQTILPPSTT